MKRRQPKVQTLAAWGCAVAELLEDVDRMVQKHEGRDPGQGARPRRNDSSCTVYAPPPK